MYNRKQAEQELIKKYNFKSTGEKHCENFYTWWHIAYYLFEKFGLDKRKPHLSSLIVSGQITHEEAQKELEKNPVYPILGIERRVMSYPKHEYTDYPTDEWLFNAIGKVIKFLRKCRF